MKYVDWGEGCPYCHRTIGSASLVPLDGGVLIVPPGGVGICCHCGNRLTRRASYDSENDTPAEPDRETT